MTFQRVNIVLEWSKGQARGHPKCQNMELVLLKSKPGKAETGRTAKLQDLQYWRMCVCSLVDDLSV
jgi:hypothetical protein